MILDLSALTLSYRVNGVDQGIAFENIERTKYRAVVSVFEMGDSVKLISYSRK